MTNLHVVYDDLVSVLRGISIQVPPGRVVALLGANGAGKTTLLRALTGVLSIHDGAVTQGQVHLDGRLLNALAPPALVAAGISLVPEGRRIFAELTVEENLRAGAHTRPKDRDVMLAAMFDLFPRLAERRNATSGFLSGGEQQMLAMGRALMAKPRYLLLDEPSLGLAPRVVEQVRDLILDVNGTGVSVLLVEQNAAMALSVASHGYVMEHGRIVMDNPSAVLIRDTDIREFYLGRPDGEQQNLRDTKSYRRHKRWLS